MSGFHLIVLGDSIMWGQGLNEADKFWSQVSDFIKPIVGGSVTTHVYAHSGAIIAPDSMDANQQPWGEIPLSYRSLTAQLAQAKQDVPALDPCLILITGGLNDLALWNVLTVDPTIPDKPAWIRHLVNDFVGPRMTDLLANATSSFPNGFTVVTSYFQIISQFSEPALVQALLLLIGAVGIINSVALASFSNQAAAMDQAYKDVISLVVARANQNREERVFFAIPAFGPHNALGADTSYVWRGTDDPLYMQRLVFTTQSLVGQIPAGKWTIVPIHLPIASIGHPNVTGAQVFAQSIKAQIAKFQAKLEPPRKAAFVSQSVPTTMIAGQKSKISITMKNISSETWVAPYALGSQSPQDNQIWNGGRVSLPAAIPPEQSAVFEFDVIAPLTPGVHGFQWRMVHEGVEWFGQFTPWVPITVVPAHMIARVTNPSLPVPLNTPVQITITATDADTQLPIPDARVIIDGRDVGSTGVPINHTFRVIRQLAPAGGLKPGSDVIFPTGWVVKAPYQNAPIDFGWIVP
jgi:lysophospholipase L1-like esterase